jgi:hypothetical protein
MDFIDYVEDLKHCLAHSKDAYDRLLGENGRLRDQRDSLVEEVLAWASEPRDHGGNPYRHDFVKLAASILRDGG